MFNIRSPYADVTIPEMNVADYVWTNAAEYPDNVALVCGMTGRQYTYEMAQQMSQKFGSSLRRLGAQKGDVIAMILQNIPEFPVGTKLTCDLKRFQNLTLKFFPLFLNLLFEQSTNLALSTPNTIC